MKTRYKTILFLTASNLILSSCNGVSSNPLDKYPGLKTSTPSEQKIETQTIASPDLFDVEIMGANQVNSGQFTEGQISEFFLKVSPKTTQMTNYKIELVEFSLTDRPSLSETNQVNVFSVKWTAPVGTIPPGQWGINLNAQFQIIVTHAENKSLVGLSKVKNIDIIVNRNNTQPRITGHTDLTAGVNEGDKVTFSIDVEDTAGMGSPRLPEIQITPYIYSNTEAYRANASQYILLDDGIKNNPEIRGERKYRFFYLLDVDRLPLDRDRLGHKIPNSLSLDICFQMRAVSAVGTLSNQTQICTKANYAAQLPKLYLDVKQLQDLKSGIENTITFQISSDHPLSVVGLKNKDLQIKSLNGKKEINCTNENLDQKNKLLCTLKWTPLCSKTETKKSLTLNADNTVGTNSRTASFTQELIVLPNPDLCAAKPIQSQKGGQ